jgi:alpha-L-fucosidase
MPTGNVQPEFMERLRGIGQWMETNGSTIYGTRGGPISPRSWGVSTQKGADVFLHVLDWKDEYLALPDIPGIVGAHRYGSNAPLELKTLSGGLLLRLPAENLDPIDTIVVVERRK